MMNLDRWGVALFPYCFWCTQEILVGIEDQVAFVKTFVSLVFLPLIYLVYGRLFCPNIKQNLITLLKNYISTSFMSVHQILDMWKGKIVSSKHLFIILFIIDAPQYS